MTVAQSMDEDSRERWRQVIAGDLLGTDTSDCGHLSELEDMAGSNLTETSEDRRQRLSERRTTRRE